MEERRAQAGPLTPGPSPPDKPSNPSSIDDQRFVEQPRFPVPNKACLRERGASARGTRSKHLQQLGLLCGAAQRDPTTNLAPLSLTSFVRRTCYTRYALPRKMWGRGAGGEGATLGVAFPRHRLDLPTNSHRIRQDGAPADSAQTQLLANAPVIGGSSVPTPRRGSHGHKGR